MDPERWPPFVRAFVDEIGAKHDGLTIAVDYQDALWWIVAGCPTCGTHVRWTIAASPPIELEPAAAQVAVTPIPGWLYQLGLGDPK